MTGFSDFLSNYQMSLTAVHERDDTYYSAKHIGIWYRGDLTKIREKIHLERKERKKWKDCYMKGMSEQMQV